MDTKRNLYDNFWHMVVGVSGQGVCIRGGGGVKARQSFALFWYLSEISRFFVLYKSRLMPSDGWSHGAAFCVLACLKLLLRLNMWLLPVVRADTISAGRLCCSIKRCCYGIWAACGNTMRIHRSLNCTETETKMAASPLWQRAAWTSSLRLYVIFDFETE